MNPAPNRFRQWLRSFAPAPVTVAWRERLRAGAGALLGLLLTGLLSPLLLPHGADWPLLIAPMGASAVLLFAVPASPLAQPWPVLGGNLTAALIGVTCARWIEPPLLATALAVALTIGATFTLRCVHPPSGAVALTAVLGGPAIHAEGYAFAWTLVALNSTLLLLCAMFWHTLTRHRYPHVAQVPLAPRFGFSREDLDAALRAHDELLDIDRNDLEALLQQAEMHAYQRRFGALTCADIMSADVLTVRFGTSLEEAWRLLRRHRVKSLPVVDDARRVIGIVTQADFIRRAGLDTPAAFTPRALGAQLRRFVTRSDRPERIGQIMATPVRTAPADKPIAELVPMFADTGHHHIPILDAQQRLVGIVTQSDLIVALYGQRLRGEGVTAQRRAS